MTPDVEQGLKQTIAELRLAKENAEAANRAKSDFLALMCHDLRSPLNAIVGLTQVLAITQPLTPRQNELISTLRASGEDMLLLINNLTAAMPEEPIDKK